MRLLRALVILGLVWLLASGTGWAQAVAGSQIAGVVRDSGGGVLPGAEITATKTDTGMTRTVFAGPDGAYVIPNLPVGPYQLRIVLQGFQTYLRDGIVLQVNSNPIVDVTLSVGAIGEQITVTAGTAMVETRSTGVGQVIDNERVMEIPLNGRQATELIFLSGLATSAPAGDLNTNKNYPTVTISVAGGQANGMTYLMDGGTHNDPFNNLNLPTPFPDAIQEFKVETSSLPARYGHHAASAVNIVTKSGTNSYRGNVFDFVRNYRFNARNFFAPQRDSLKRNQFGGTVGGPVIKDKVFFFAGYQGRVEKSNPAETVSFVPTQAMLNGDFTGITAASCSGRQIILSPAAGFVDNRIDPSRFNSASMKFLQKVPVSTDPCGRLQYGIPNNNTEHQTLTRADYSISSSQSLVGRYLYAVYDNPATYDGVNVLTLSRTGQNNKAHSFVLGHNWIVSAGMINSLHVTYNKTLNDRPLPEFFSPVDLGINVYGPQPGFMGVTVTNGFGIGAGATNPGFFDSDSFQIANDTDIVRGRHQVSFGANWIRTKIETLNNRPSNGQFTFNGQTTGLGLADFMLGRLGGFLQGNPVYDFDENDYVGAYIQDEWKARANLTLNAGLRWEPYLPIKNSLGYSSNFDKARFDQGIRSRTYPQAPPGLFFPGDPEFPGNAVMNSKIAQFAPRLGVVWTPDDKTAVRAGWGIFYDTPHLFFNTRFANNPPWGAQITLTNPAGGFTDPYLNYPGGNPFPALATGWQTQPFPAFGVYVNAPLDTQPTALQQWNVGAQRQFGDWLVSASYLGNRSSHLWRATELNPAVYSTGATTGTTNQRRVLFLQDPVMGQFYGTIGQLDDTGQSQLPRYAPVPAAAAEGQLQRPLQLHVVPVQERPGDDGADGTDRGRPKQPGSRLLVLRLGSPARGERVGCGADAPILERHHASPVQRLADRTARAVAERQLDVGDDRRRQRPHRTWRSACRADSRRSLRRQNAGQLPEPQRVHLTGSRHLQRVEAEHDQESVSVGQRSGGDSNLQSRRQLDPVPLGSLQRRESRELQRASRGAQQLELRPDSDRRGAAHHAVCAEV